jgi:hypothetical protein
MHTAKLTEFTAPKDIQMDEDTTLKGATTSLESSCCPFCKSKAYTENAEEKVSGAINLADVVSLKDCAPNEVDVMLGQGYVVYQTWQKNVFVVKLKDKAPVSTSSKDELGDIIKAGIKEATQ